MSNIVPIDKMRVMSKAVAQSGLLGMNEHQAFGLMLMSESYNMHPMKFVQDFHIIQGRASKKTETAFRDFKRAGGRCSWNITNEKEAEAKLTAPDGDTIVMKYTIEQAKKAGLIKSGSNWEKNPADMIRNRVLSKGIKAIYPEAYNGFVSDDEAQDLHPVEIVDNTPNIEDKTDAELKVSKVELTNILTKTYNFTGKDIKDFAEHYELGNDLESLKELVSNKELLENKINEFENIGE